MSKEYISKTYTFLFYQKSDSDYIVNGGRLFVTDREYIVKNLFKTVARFSKEETTVTSVSDASSKVLYGKGICLSDGTRGIHLYFTPKTAREVYSRLGLV